MTGVRLSVFCPFLLTPACFLLTHAEEYGARESPQTRFYHWFPCTGFFIMIQSCKFPWVEMAPRVSGDRLESISRAVGYVVTLTTCNCRPSPEIWYASKIVQASFWTALHYMWWLVPGNPTHPTAHRSRGPFNIVHTCSFHRLWSVLQFMQERGAGIRSASCLASTGRGSWARAGAGPGVCLLHRERHDMV